MNETLISALLPLLMILVSTARGLHKDINLADEGYLIYGTIALMRGDVPIRDFRAYDPGRYLWCAVFFWLFGPGFVTARVAMACLSCISAALVVYLVHETSQSIALAAVTGCLSVLWMHPRYKQGEILFSVVCVASIYALAGGSSQGGWIATVAFLAALYGHNILIYMIAAFVVFGLTQFTAGEPVLLQFENLLSWLVGYFALYVVIAALFPGYLSAFWTRKIRQVIKRGSTNLPLTKPWLWSGSVVQFWFLNKMRQFGLKAIFTALPIIYGFVLISLVQQPEVRALPSGQLLVASAVAGLVFMHYIWSRPDQIYFYHVIQPLILLSSSAAAFLMPLELAVSCILLGCIATVALLLGMPDFRLAWGPKTPSKPFYTHYECLQVAPALAERLNKLKMTIRLYSEPWDPVFAVPLNLSILAAVDRCSAVYDCFPVYGSTKREQSQMLLELETSRPSLAIIGKDEIDGRAELLFEHNYPEVISYIQQNYARISDTTDETVYLRKDLNH